MTAPTAMTPTRIGRTANGYSQTAGLAAVDAGNGNSFANTGRELLVIANGDVASKTATIVTTKQVDGLDVGDLPCVVGAGITRIIGPFPPSVYGSTVTVTWSAGTSVTAAVIQMVPETD